MGDDLLSNWKTKKFIFCQSVTLSDRIEVNSMEIIGLTAGALTTTAFVPQVFKAYKTRSTKDISLSMYSIFLTGIILWLFYGYKMKSLAIVLTNAVTGLLALSIFILKLRHQKGSEN